MSLPKGCRFLDGVPVDHVLHRLQQSGGNEISSGKIFSAESSAALAINSFGWFIGKPEMMPPFPDVAAGWPPHSVEVEYCARFPWSGGRHPWLDAFIETPDCIIGVESKRFEPFRDRKTASFSDAYDRSVWGNTMQSFELMKDQLRAGKVSFVHLDGAQLVKHALGLASEAERKGKRAILLYLYAEPERIRGREIKPEIIGLHRTEVAKFGAGVAGSAVAFRACSYRQWLSGWTSAPTEVRAHGTNIIEEFMP